MEFEVGQAVRCIVDGPWRDQYGAPGEGPAPGERCIVSAIAISVWEDAPRLALALAEYPAGHPGVGDRAPLFAADHFRPESDEAVRMLREGAASPPVLAPELAGLLT